MLHILLVLHYKMLRYFLIHKKIEFIPCQHPQWPLEVQCCRMSAVKRCESPDGLIHKFASDFFFFTWWSLLPFLRSLTLSIPVRQAAEACKQWSTVLYWVLHKVLHKAWGCTKRYYFCSSYLPVSAPVFIEHAAMKGEKDTKIKGSIVVLPL